MGVGGYQIIVDWDNDQIDKYAIVKLIVKIHNLNYSKAKKVNKMECDVLITNVKMLNQREAEVVLRREKKE